MNKSCHCLSIVYIHINHNSLKRLILFQYAFLEYEIQPTKIITD